MARNAIESDFRTSKMAAEKNKNKSVSIWNGQNCYRKWISDIQNGRSIWNGQKCNVVLLVWKWISDIQNGRRQPFWQKFPKKIKLRIDLKLPEMRSKVNFGHPKWPTAGILSKISKKMKVAYWSKMARNSKVNFGHPKWAPAVIL